MTYLPQWAVEGETLPGYDEIDDDGEFMERAGAEVAIKLQRAGHGLAPSVSSGTVIYQYLTSTINELCALHLASAIGHLIDSDQLDTAWGRMRARLRDIEQGRDLAELTQDNNQRNAIFSHKDTTRATIDASRRTMRDEM